MRLTLELAFPVTQNIFKNFTWYSREMASYNVRSFVNQKVFFFFKHFKNFLVLVFLLIFCSNSFLYHFYFVWWFWVRFDFFLVCVALSHSSEVGVFSLPWLTFAIGLPHEEPGVVGLVEMELIGVVEFFILYIFGLFLLLSYFSLLLRCRL